IPVHGERRGLPHVELEIRQDLIAEPAGQRAWADRLARLLPAALDQLALSPTPAEGGERERARGGVHRPVTARRNPPPPNLPDWVPPPAFAGAGSLPRCGRGTTAEGGRRWRRAGRSSPVPTVMASS